MAPVPWLHASALLARTCFSWPQGLMARLHGPQTPGPYQLNLKGPSAWPPPPLAPPHGCMSAEFKRLQRMPAPPLAPPFPPALPFSWPHGLQGLVAPWLHGSMAPCPWTLSAEFQGAHARPLRLLRPSRPHFPVFMAAWSHNGPMPLDPIS